MSLTFNKREKTLLIILAIILLVGGFVKLYLQPRLEEISNLKLEIARFNDTYNTNLIYQDKVMTMSKDVKFLSQKVKAMKSLYPPELNPEEIIVFLKNAAKSVEFSLGNINISEPSEVSIQSAENPSTSSSATDGSTPIENSQLIQNIKNLKQRNQNLYELAKLLDVTDNVTDKSKDDVIIPEGSPFKVSVSISFQSYNKQLMDFLRIFENTTFKVNISGLQIGTGSDGKLNGALNIDFVGIKGNKQKDFYILSNGEWTPDKGIGKSNIFEPYSGYVGSITKAGKGETVSSNDNAITLQDINKYDFTMSVQRSGDSDAPPSVSITAKSLTGEAATAIPVVYGDNKGTEETELYLEGRNGKYFCKYRTQSQAFPESGYQQLAEFSPIQNTIKVLVLSASRFSKDDVAGINLKIVNKTDKKLVVNVMKDDKSAPRVKVGNTVGNVNVLFN